MIGIRRGLDRAAVLERAAVAFAMALLIVSLNRDNEVGES